MIQGDTKSKESPLFPKINHLLIYRVLGIVYFYLYLYFIISAQPYHDYLAELGTYCTVLLILYGLLWKIQMDCVKTSQWSFAGINLSPFSMSG